MFITQAQLPAPPAGGAAFRDVVIAFIIAAAVALPVLWFVWRERTGKPTLLGRFADWVSTKDGLPRWVGLPSYLTLITLLTAGFGVWWDVPLHMQNGRDEGPLANPSHYPIYLAILGFFSAGIISATLAKGELPRRTVRITQDWRSPLGSLVIIGAGLIAAAGFPADDTWHRLFGQDVTEWGPTHVMMIGGAVTCVLGLPLLHAEARQLGAPGALGFAGRLRGAIMLSVCIVPFAFLMEFDLGVPQFPAATQFIIAGFLTGWIFTAVRAYFGPGGGLLAWGIYLGAHAFLAVTIILLQDVLVGRFLLFLPAAILVELVAMVLKPQRGLAYWLTSGVLIGTVGMAAEWAWSTVFMPLPQPLSVASLPLMLGVGTAASLGGALFGLWHVRQIHTVASPGVADEFASTEKFLQHGKFAALARPGATVFSFWKQRQTPDLAVTSGSTWRRNGVGLVGIGVFIALMGVFAPPQHTDFTGTMHLDYQDGITASECGSPTKKCMATVTVTLDPSVADTDKIWFYGLAWQGRHRTPAEGLPTDPISGDPGIMRVAMIPTGTPGQYRSEHPLPLYGSWKTLIRAHTAPSTLSALPLYAPDDPAITQAKGRRVLVNEGDVVRSMSEPGFLQRETSDDVPGWLWTTGYVGVGAAWAVLLAFYGWCYAAAAAGASRRKAPVESAPAVKTTTSV